MSNDAVIVAATRSPIGRAYKGAFRDTRPEDLAAQVITAALAQVPNLDPTQVDDIVLGCGQPGGEHGSNLSRVVTILLGLDTVPAATVTRYCAGSIQSIRMAFHAIAAGEGNVFIAGGVESSSRHIRGSSDYLPQEAQDLVGGSWHHPAFDKPKTTGEKAPGQVWTDPRRTHFLPNVYMSMGETAENVAEICGVSREEQDLFALRSQTRALAAKRNGFWAKDITPIQNSDGDLITADESMRPETTLETLAELQPVFRKNGTVTAGNSCPINDGASALIVMSERYAKSIGATPLARIISTGVAALSPEIMGLAPIMASEQALKRASMTIKDIDLFELNEAFAAQALPCTDKLGITDDKLNVNGGAIAIGHPFAMTGARLTTSLINSLQFHDREIGMASMCVAGGQGMSVLIQRM